MGVDQNALHVAKTWSTAHENHLNVFSVYFFVPNHLQVLFGYACFDPCTDHLQKIWGSPNVQWSWSLYSDRLPPHTATSHCLRCELCTVMGVPPNASKVQLAALALSPSGDKKVPRCRCSVPLCCFAVLCHATRLWKEIASLGLEREERQHQFLAPEHPTKSTVLEVACSQPIGSTMHTDCVSLVELVLRFLLSWLVNSISSHFLRCVVFLFIYTHEWNTATTHWHSTLTHTHTHSDTEEHKCKHT